MMVFHMLTILLKLLCKKRNNNIHHQLLIRTYVRIHQRGAPISRKTAQDWLKELS